MALEVKLKVLGVVQGVGYRAHCRKLAEECGVTGYADNLADGSVEVLACGEGQEIAKFVELVKKTRPTGARIDEVQLLYRKACEYRPPSFRII